MNPEEKVYLEQKFESVGKRMDSMDGKLDTLIAKTSENKTENKGQWYVFGVCFSWLAWLTFKVTGIDLAFWK